MAIVPEAAGVPPPQEVTEPAAEQPKPKEKVSKETQQKEILQSGSAVIQSLGSELDEMEASNEALQDAGNKAILSLYRLPYQEPFDSDTRPGGISLKDENDPNDKPVIIRYKGNNVIIKSIRRFDGENCVCITDSSTDSNIAIGTDKGDPTIPMSEVLRGQLLAVADKIFDSPQISEAEKAVLKLYIDLARDGESGIPNLGSEEIDTIIVQAAKEIGVTSNANLEGFINTIMPEVKPKEGETLSETQLDNNTKREAALEKLKGKNLADAQTVVEVVMAGGLSAESAETNMAQAEGKVEKLEETLKRFNSNSSEYKECQKQLNQAKMERAIWKTTAEVLRNPSKLQSKFDEVNTGQYKRETAVKFCQALEKGDYEEMINLLIPSFPEKDKAGLEAYLKSMGIGGFILSFLLESFQQEFMAEQR